MKQLSTLNIARLRTEECFGYLKQVKAETANLPSEEPPAAQTAATTTFDSGFNATPLPPRLRQPMMPAMPLGVVRTTT